VYLDCSHAYAEIVGNHLVRPASRKRIEHLTLAPAERADLLARLDGLSVS
jgi:hypothetical protein